MSCGCGDRAVEAFKEVGYEEVDGFLVKEDDRVSIAEVRKHHARETMKRPEVTVAAVRSARDKAVALAARLGITNTEESNDGTE